MSVQIKDRVDNPVLPTDITLRVPAVARKPGGIASLLGAIVAVGANWQLDRAHKRHRSGYAPPIPDYLREDIGLPPLPPKWHQWWEQRW
jgi:hypothetical protein